MSTDEYFIIIAKPELDSLENFVNSRMKSGFIPHGSLQAVKDENSPTGYQYIQPMVLKGIS